MTEQARELFEKAIVDLIWDTDRAVKQALRHTENKTREPDGKLYDTCIRILLTPLWDAAITAAAAEARAAAIEECARVCDADSKTDLPDERRRYLIHSELAPAAWQAKRSARRIRALTQPKSGEL